MIADLKKSFNFALSDIQKDYEHKIQEINGTIRNHRSLNAHLENQISKVKQEISTCIDVKLLYSDRQAREAWQNGCDEMISSIIQRIADMDLMFKKAFICVDNSHATDAAKYYGLAPVARLNKIDKEELDKEPLKGTNPQGIVFNEYCGWDKGEGDKTVYKIHHPSRKHLENKLREKNVRIKELEDQLCM